jgi:hypothetical protein
MVNRKKRQKDKQWSKEKKTERQIMVKRKKTEKHTMVTGNRKTHNGHRKQKSKDWTT